MSIDELRKKSRDNLNQDLLEKREELFKLRMQRGTGQLTRPDQMRKVRRDIARVKTLLNEKPKSEDK